MAWVIELLRIVPEWTVQREDGVTVTPIIDQIDLELEFNQLVQ